MNKLFNLVLICFVVALTASCDSATSTLEQEEINPVASSSQSSVPCNTTSHAATPLGELQLRRCDIDGGNVVGGGAITVTQLLSKESATRSFVAPPLPTGPGCYHNGIAYNLVAGLESLPQSDGDNQCDRFWLDGPNPKFDLRLNKTYLVESANSSRRFLTRYSGVTSAPDTRATFYNDKLVYLECSSHARCIGPNDLNPQEIGGQAVTGGHAVLGTVPAKYEYDTGYGTVTSSNSSYGIMTVTGGTGGFQACPLTYLTYSSFNDLRGSRPSAGQNVKVVGVIDTNDCDVKLYDWMPN